MPVIQQYQLGDCIGKGAFGTVFRGLNLTNGKVVAVKQISLENVTTLRRPSEHPSSRPNPNDPKQPLQRSHQASRPPAMASAETVIDSCLSEVAILKKLQHPNIVRYLGFVQTDANLYQILEYCENGSLRSIYKKFGRFPEHLVGVYLGQVLAGLTYLHKQGIIHRDIKGANILSTKDGRVKLADFGVSTLVNDEDPHSVGSPYWMAPEVIELGGVTTAADIWSLGCTVIELLQGEPPYGRLSTVAALFRMVQDPHPPLPTGLSSLVRDFLRHCFPKDPSQRGSAPFLSRHPWIQKCRPPQTGFDDFDDRYGTVTLPTQTQTQDQNQTSVPANPPNPTASNTTFQEAIRTVQQWNADPVNRPPTGRAITRTRSNTIAAQPPPISRPTSKHDLARYCSNAADEENWDQDFDDLSNLTLSNLKQTEKVLELTLSPSSHSVHHHLHHPQQQQYQQLGHHHTQQYPQALRHPPKRLSSYTHDDGLPSRADSPTEPDKLNQSMSSTLTIPSDEAVSLLTPSITRHSTRSPRTSYSHGSYPSINLSHIFLSSTNRPGPVVDQDNWDDDYDLPADGWDFTQARRK